MCDPAFLLVAWQRVRRNRGALSAGVDNQSAYDIEQRRGHEAFLEELREQLKQRRFVPLPVLEHLIPKADGRKRPLGIPTVTDRVVQAAAKLVLGALEEALWARSHPKGLTHHSVSSSQYLSIRYTERLAKAGIESSVGSRGDSYDNALAATINGRYKAEVIHRRGPWLHRDAVEYVTLAWIDWFNNRRLFEPIGNIPPAESEAAYYRQLDESAMLA